MTIALDASTPARWAGTPAQSSSITSASFTAPANSFLVCCVSMDGTSAQAPHEPTVSDSGGLTWTKQIFILFGTTLNGGYTAIWTASPASSASRTVSVNNPTGNSTLRTSAKCYVFTGVDVSGTPVDTTGANNSGASTTNNLTTSSVTPGADGVLVVCDCEWNELGVETSSDLNIGFDSADYATQISVASGAKACSSGVAVTGNLNAGGTAAAQHKWTQIVVRAAGGGGGTSLSLAAQSAAWTNNTLTPLGILVLGQESVSWTDAALAELAALALAAESAAWTDSGLAEAAQLALAAEPATWSDPALSGLAKLALGVESAAWSSPALADLAALALGAQSAAWTNPALLSAGLLAVQSAQWANPALSNLAALALAAEAAAASNPGLSLLGSNPLAAESAGWAPSLLSELAALAIAAEAAAGTNPSLSPFGGNPLAAQASAWTIYSLIVPSPPPPPPPSPSACPPVVNPYLGLEYIVVIPGLPSLVDECCVISNTESVTFYRKTSDGTFDGGTTVPNALRLEVDKEGIKIKGRLNWLIWTSQAGNTPAKPGDYILDGSGLKWVAERVDVQAWGNRYFLHTLQER